MTEEEYLAKCEDRLVEIRARGEVLKAAFPMINEQHGCTWKTFGNEVHVSNVEGIATVFEIAQDGSAVYYPYPWPEEEASSDE